MDGLQILFLMVVGFMMIAGLISALIIDKLVAKFPSLESVFFYTEDVDRDGNPIDEDF